MQININLKFNNAIDSLSYLEQIQRFHLLDSSTFKSSSVVYSKFSVGLVIFGYYGLKMHLNTCKWGNFEVIVIWAAIVTCGICHNS